MIAPLAWAPKRIAFAFGHIARTRTVATEAGGGRGAVLNTHTRRPRSLWIGVALAAVLVASALMTPPIADASTRSAGVPSPRGDLYEPPHPLPLAPPGTLIWAKKFKGLTLNPPSTIWQILYHSRSRTGHDIAVSGFAIVPKAPAPDGDRPVYAWAHGTAGLGDQCAPSHKIRDNLPPFGGQQLERGAVLVATDYEGLGTPGPRPDPSDSPKPTPCSTASAPSQPSPVSEPWVTSSSPATRKVVLPRC